MNRRTFVSTIIAAATVPLTLFGTPRRYGLMTMDRWDAEEFRARGAHTFIDGVDITNDCFLFNDVEGWADVYLRDANGQFYVNATRDSIVNGRMYGRVEVRIPDKER